METLQEKRRKEWDFRFSKEEEKERERKSGEARTGVGKLH